MSRVGTTQYEWTGEQRDFTRFNAAKRKIAKEVNAILPPDFKYKIIAPYNPHSIRWEIKMDYTGRPGGVFATGVWGILRWRPCMTGWDNVDSFYMEICTGARSPDFQFAPSVGEIDKHLPAVKKCVQMIFDALHPDPMMQLHAAAKRAEKATA